jgi:hypothetical protein
LFGGVAIVVLLVVGALLFRFIRKRMLGASSEA